jgi:ATP-dependent DNA ligase
LRSCSSVKLKTSHCPVISVAPTATPVTSASSPVPVIEAMLEFWTVHVAPITHQAIKTKSRIVHGEIVGLDAKGRPRFEDPQNRKKCRIVYFAFDLLMLNHKDLRGEPLVNRKEALKRIVTSAPHLRLTDYITEEREQLFSAIAKVGLEGMVAKKADSLYVGGRTKDWLKIKTRAAHEQMKRRIETWGR